MPRQGSWCCSLLVVAAVLAQRHRHNQVDVAVLADRPQHARRLGGDHLEGDLRCADDGQRLAEVLDVEGDLAALAGDLALDRAGVCADAGGIGAEHDRAGLRRLARAHAELDDVLAHTGDQPSQLHRPVQLAHIEDGAGRAALWQDALDVGVLAVDQARGKGEAGRREDRLGRGGAAGCGRHQAHADALGGVTQQATQLAERRRRDDHLLLRRNRRRQGDLLQREAKAIGRGERGGALMQAHIDAGEHGAGVGVGGGAGHLVDSLFERRGGEAGLRRALGRRRRHGGEFLGRGAVDLGAEAGAGHRDDLVLAVDLEGHLVVGQAGDQVGEEPGRHQDAAILLDLGAAPDGDREVEIGRAEAQPLLVGRQQHVAEDGHHRLARHGAAHLGERLFECLLLDSELHGHVLSGWCAHTPSRIAWAGRVCIG